MNVVVSHAKAIGIILMVLAHAGFYTWGSRFIGMFHMPLFFMLSGYCFKEKYLMNLMGFVWRRIKGIYCPFVKWSLLFLALHNVFFRINIYNGEFGYRGKPSFLYDMQYTYEKAKLIVSALLGNDQLLGGYWFLHTLFFASFIGYGCIWLMSHIPIGGGKKDAVIRIIAPSSLLALSVICLATGKGIWRLGIGYKEMLAAAFFVTGYLMKKLKMSLSWWTTLGLFAIVVVVSINRPSSMLALSPIDIIPYYFVAIVGTVMTMSIASRSAHLNGWLCSMLSYIGTHTMEILTWHLLSFKLVSLFIIWVEIRPITHLSMFPVVISTDDYPLKAHYWPIYFIVGIAVPMAICKTIDCLRKKAFSK